MTEPEMKNAPELSEEAAQALLQNVFAACDQAPNTVPLSKLSSYSEYRREKYALQKGILLLVLVLFLAIPFCFLLPRFRVTDITDEGAPVPRYAITVDSRFPLRRVTAELNGHNVTVYETGDRQFAVEPAANGTLTVTVTNRNHQYETVSLEVTGVDREPPEMTGDSKTNNLLYIYLEDDGSGIDYDAAYAETMSGEVILPAKTGEGYIAFPYPKESVSIFVPDERGNILHLVVTLA